MFLTFIKDPVDFNESTICVSRRCIPHSSRREKKKVNKWIEVKMRTPNRPPPNRGDQEIAQSARYVKDKRLRRACGILDIPHCQCWWAIKGL